MGRNRSWTPRLDGLEPRLALSAAHITPDLATRLTVQVVHPRPAPPRPAHTIKALSVDRPVTPPVHRPPAPPAPRPVPPTPSAPAQPVPVPVPVHLAMSVGRPADAFIN